MTEKTELTGKDQPTRTLGQLRETARRDGTGFVINADNLDFHSLPDTMRNVVRNGATILVDIGGNVLVLPLQDKKGGK